MNPFYLMDTATDLDRNVSNPNILINSDFAIAQRGAGWYPENPQDKAEIYGMDRWCITNTGYMSQLDGENDGILHSATGVMISIRQGRGTTELRQYVEKMMPNHWYTAQIKFKGDAKVYTGSQLVTSGGEGEFVSGNGWRLFWRRTLPRQQYYCIGIEYTNTAPGAPDYLKIDWVKLEMGQQATRYVLPDPALELARCQRYYFRAGYPYLIGVSDGNCVRTTVMMPQIRKLPGPCYRERMQEGWATCTFYSHEFYEYSEERPWWRILESDPVALCIWLYMEFDQPDKALGTCIINITPLVFDAEIYGGEY